MYDSGGAGSSVPGLSVPATSASPSSTRPLGGAAAGPTSPPPSTSTSTGTSTGGGSGGALPSISLETPSHALHSLYMQRVLRIRETRAGLLGHLNYFRSVHKMLCRDECVYHRSFEHSGSFSGGELHADAGVAAYIPVDNGAAAAHASAASAAASASTSAAAASVHAHAHPSLSCLYDPTSVIARLSTRAQLEDRCDQWEWDRSGVGSGGLIVVRDARKKVRIVYDAALRDLTELESDLLALASIYIERHQYVGMGMKGDVDTELAAYQSLLHSLDGGAAPSAAAVAATAAAAANALRNRPEGVVAQAASSEHVDPFYPDPLLISSKSVLFFLFFFLLFVFRIYSVLLYFAGCIHSRTDDV